MWPHPFQGQFVVRRLGLAMFNQHTKFEVSKITCIKDMKCIAICKNSRLSHPLEELGVHLWLDGKRMDDFLLMIIEHFCKLSQLRHYKAKSVKIGVLWTGGSLWVQILVFFCSRLLSTEVDFYWQKQQNHILCHPLGDLGATYTVHLWLGGKRMVNFLLVLIEHFC